MTIERDRCEAVTASALQRVKGVRQSEDKTTMAGFDDFHEVQVARIPLDAIEPDPTQPRKDFSEVEIERLAKSIRELGMLQLPTVRPVAFDGAGLPTRYMIVVGERRWRAASRAGWGSLDCIIVAAGDQATIDAIRRRDQQYAENALRLGLSPVEEAFEFDSRLKLQLEAEGASGADTRKKEVLTKVAAERNMEPRVAYRLLALLRAPRVLRDHVGGRRLTREVGLIFAAAWSSLEKRTALKDKAAYRARAAIEEFANERGLSPRAASTVEKYAREVGRTDVVELKAAVKRVSKLRDEAEARFGRWVEAAVREQWTVTKARAKLELEEDPAEQPGNPGAVPAPPVSQAKPRPVFAWGTGRLKGRLHVDVGRIQEASLQEIDDLIVALAEVRKQADEARARLASRPGE